MAEGDRIDVTAVSKGKGFAGVMKRHGFSGQKASHGAPASTVRLAHRLLRHALTGVQGLSACPGAWAARR